MGIEIRVLDEDLFDEFVRVDARNFGSTWGQDDLDRERRRMELDRFRCAVDDGRIVGTAGSFAFDTAVHGGGSLPTGGVTWVSVSVTHRRRGILGRLLDALHDDIDARGEPIAALGASEGGIYERFGYGIATRRHVIDVDTRAAAFRPELVPPAGGVRILDIAAEPDAAFEAVAERWRRFQPRHPGEITRPDAWHRASLLAHGAAGVLLLHDDGYAVWTVQAEWDHGHPRHVLTLHELVGITAEAHAALWHTVLSVDLVARVRSYRIPPDDPLPFLLRDPRAVRTVDADDGVWVHVRDVARSFDARTYGIDADVVIEVDGVRWRIGTSGCRRVRTRPDLVGSRSVLGPLLLGGVRPSTLVAGRRLEARDATVLRRADALLSLAPTPYNRTPF